ncbi:MAG: hypothetical protein M5U01_03980 [Ardenticatenaceae bacterium]|nr:hypothetical protein [Ardenticatenaceae bacterium]
MDPNALLTDYAHMGHLAESTRALLALLLDQGSLPPEQRDVLDETLLHLTDVREGLILSLRADAADARELQDLVRYTLGALDWSWLQELGLELMPDETIYLPRLQLLAFAHSYLTLALMPRLPRRQITFPQPRSYADIPVPRRPGEVLERIEELERVLIRVQIRASTDSFTGDILRRTYGFFETSAWLVRDHLRLFGRHDD